MTIDLGMIGELAGNSVDWSCNKMCNKQWRVDTWEVAVDVVTQNIPSFLNWIQRCEQPERNM